MEKFFVQEIRDDYLLHKQYMQKLDDWKKLFQEKKSCTGDSKNIEFILKFIDYVINYTSRLSCRSQILICNQSFALLQELVDSKFLNNFVEQATQRVFDIVIEEGKNTWCIKKGILKVFNYCLRNVKRDIRYKTIRELSDMYLFKIIDSISSYGDYDLQVVIVETIFRMYGKEAINARLNDLIPESQELSQCFVDISLERFDEDVRLFLNKLNRISGKIFSIQCDEVMIGDLICLPPIVNDKTMWIDFNTWDSAITWYCDESSLRDNLGEDENLWNLITLFVSDVKTVYVHTAADNSKVIVHCDLESPCLSKFEDDQHIFDQGKKLSLLFNKSKETDKLINDIIPALFGSKLQKLQEAKIKCSKNVPVPAKLEYKPLNISLRKRSGSADADAKLNLPMKASSLDPFNIRSGDTVPSSRSSRAFTIASFSLSSDDLEETRPIRILSGSCSGYVKSNTNKDIISPRKKISTSIITHLQIRNEDIGTEDKNSPEIFETAQYSIKSSESFQTADFDSQKTYLLKATKNEQIVSKEYGKKEELPEMTEDFSSLEVNIFQNNFVSKNESSENYVDIECKTVESPGFEERIIISGEILCDEPTTISNELLVTKPQVNERSLKISNSNFDSMKVDVFRDVGNIEKNRHTNAKAVIEEHLISQTVKNCPLKPISQKEVDEYSDDQASLKGNMSSETQSNLDTRQNGDENGLALLKNDDSCKKEFEISERNDAKKPTIERKIPNSKRDSLIPERKNEMIENLTTAEDNNINCVKITKLDSVGNTKENDIGEGLCTLTPNKREADDEIRRSKRIAKNVTRKRRETNFTIKKYRGKPKNNNLKNKENYKNRKQKGRPKKNISEEEDLKVNEESKQVNITQDEENDENGRRKSRTKKGKEIMIDGGSKQVTKHQENAENQKHGGRIRSYILNEREELMINSIEEISAEFGETNEKSMKVEIPKKCNENIDNMVIKKGKRQKNIAYEEQATKDYIKVISIENEELSSGDNEIQNKECVNSETAIPELTENKQITTSVEANMTDLFNLKTISHPTSHLETVQEDKDVIEYELSNSEVNQTKPKTSVNFEEATFRDKIQKENKHQLKEIPAKTDSGLGNTIDIDNTTSPIVDGKNTELSEYNIEAIKDNQLSGEKIDHDTLGQKMCNDPSINVCGNDEENADDNEGDYSGRIHTETYPLPKITIDPEQAFETLFGNKKELESNLIQEKDIEQLISDNVMTAIESSSNEVEDILNFIQTEKNNEYRNSEVHTFEDHGDSEKVVLDQNDMENICQENDQKSIIQTIKSSHVTIESIEKRTDSCEEKNDYAREIEQKTVNERATKLDKTFAKKHTTSNYSAGAHQTVSTTPTGRRKRKLYDPNDRTYLENLSSIENESLLQKDRELSNLDTKESGLNETFKKPFIQPLEQTKIKLISSMEDNSKIKRKLRKDEISYKDMKKELEMQQETIRKQRNSDHRAKRARKSSLNSIFSDMVGELREELGMGKEPLREKLKRNRQEDYSSQKRTSKKRQRSTVKRTKNKPKILPLPSSSSVNSEVINENLDYKRKENVTTGRVCKVDSEGNNNNILHYTNYDMESMPVNLEKESFSRPKTVNQKKKINVLSNITIKPRITDDEIQSSKKPRLSSQFQFYIPDIKNYGRQENDMRVQENNVCPSYLGMKVLKPAPIWESIAVFNGEFKQLKSADYLGKYLVFLFYPLDFTPACPKEILEFSKRIEDFRQINTEIVGCSVDSHFVHLAWLNTRLEDGGPGKINFPLLSDLKHTISMDFGVYMEDLGHTLRGLFVIDTKGIIRQITMNDLLVGNSVNETLRFIQEFQNVDEPIMDN